MSATRQTPRVTRTILAGAAIVAVFLLIVVVRLLQSRQQAGLIERIRAAGGFVTHDPPPSLRERIAAYRQGAPLEQDYTAVRLYTAVFTGEWLRDQNDLSDLRITDLTLAETAFSDADLARLIAGNPLEVVDLRAENVGNRTIDALAGSANLRLLQIRESPLNNGQFARLPLEQLEELRIDATDVTPPGLQELRRAQRLVLLIIDGRQIDETAVGVLGGLPALRQLELVGEAVTDDHLALLHGFSALESVVLRRTAVTGEGMNSLQSALPNCQIDRR